MSSDLKKQQLQAALQPEPEQEPELEKALELTFDAASNEINLTLFEHIQAGPVPLNLKFKYRPECGAVPIQEVTEGRTDRIKEHYYQLWSLDGDMHALAIDQVFHGEEVTIDDKEIERFCRVVGNEQESYKGAKEVPMDFSIKLGWRVSGVVRSRPFGCLCGGAHSARPSRPALSTRWCDCRGLQECSGDSISPLRVLTCEATVTPC